jgi:predicted acylesterase/phospholipase RssA
VGALNAAKLAEGPGSFSALQDLWLSIQDNDSIYRENPAMDEVIENIDRFTGWAPKAIFAGLAAPLIGHLITEVTRVPPPDPIADLDRIQSLYRATPLRRMIRRNLDPRRVAESGIKLRIATVNRDTGKLCYITETGAMETEDGAYVHRGGLNHDPFPDQPGVVPVTIHDGVIASSAIPLMFEPASIQGEAYWDGAIRDDVPVMKALQLGATDLIIILSSPRKYEPTPLSSLPSMMNVTPVKSAMQAMDIMADEIAKDDLMQAINGMNMLHEVGPEAAAKIQSFPVTRRRPGFAALPGYVVIEPPFRISEITKFDHRLIRANIHLGEIVAKHTRVDMLDRMQPEMVDNDPASGRAPSYRHPTQDPSKTDFDLALAKKIEIRNFLSAQADFWLNQNQWNDGPELHAIFSRILREYEESHLDYPLRRSAA